MVIIVVLIRAHESRKKDLKEKTQGEELERQEGGSMHVTWAENRGC